MNSSQMRLVVVIVLLVVGGVFFVVTRGSGSDDTGDRRRLERALEKCEAIVDQPSIMDHYLVADAGKTLVGSSVHDPEGFECIFDQLGTTLALVSNFEATTALMGRQREHQDGLTYEWSYHPSNGVDLTITED